MFKAFRGPNGWYVAWEGEDGFHHQPFHGGRQSKESAEVEASESAASQLQRLNHRPMPTLHHPFEISPRLLPALRVGGAFISIEYSDRPGDDGRVRYQWYIDLDAGEEFSGDDLQSGCQGGSLQQGMESLLSFLGAAAESYRSKMDWDKITLDDNASLFPRPILRWAYQNSGEIAMLQFEIEE